MGVADKVKNFSNQVQQTTKQATYSLSHIIIRLISGFFIGLVLALIAQELFQFGTLLLVFTTLLFMSIIYKLLSRYSVVQILIFDLICVLIVALLRMYILIAPN